MNEIEEVDSQQFVEHYLGKAYTELDHSPEALVRAALEFVQRRDQLLSQPGAMDNLVRLAQQIAPQPEEPSPAATPEATAPPPTVPRAAAAVQAESSLPTAAASSEGAPSVTMAPAEEAAEEEEEQEIAEGEVPKGMKSNAGNGADFSTYSWTQTLQEVFINVPVPQGTKGRGCDVSITRSNLCVGLKGAPPVLDGPLFAAVQPDECLWNLVDGSMLEITLQKVDGMQWWRAVMVGQPEIDLGSVEPEASKLSDLDGETRATVEKMMFDQRQKALGRPTSDEMTKQEAYKRFMEAHPEMDFSGAQFT